MLTSCAVVHPPSPLAAPTAELPGAKLRRGALERVSSIDRAMSAALVTFNENVAAALVDRQRLGYYSNRQHANLERAYVRLRGLSKLHPVSTTSKGHTFDQSISAS